MNKPKIGIISSRGGHFFQVYRLKPWWERYDHFWVTYAGEDTTPLLEKEQVYYGFSPETRNVWNALRNLVLAWKIIIHEKPTTLVSCGAGIAPPFFYVGKLFGAKLVFIEPYDFVCYPSLSAKMVEPITDYLLVQHPRQTRFFRRAKHRGAVL